MTSTIDPSAIAPVRKSITVKASPERAFHVFTAEFESWWPRTHHIGKVPLQRAIVQPWVGGRLYSEQIDGTECDWGRVIAWEPPMRFVMAWQITPEWGYEPDAAHASEVEVRFTTLADGSTRVDLEHRHFERHGAGGAVMRKAVDSEMGWGDLLKLYGARAEGASR